LIFKVAFHDSSYDSFLQTDTASVLYEAIGYIEFLHGQIEVMLLICLFLFLDYINVFAITIECIVLLNILSSFYSHPAVG
jgi:hypothetical protein